MSYKVDQEIFGVQYDNDVAIQRGVFIQPLLHSDQQPKKINFAKLVVKSQHAVNHEFQEAGEEKKHEGFLLDDEAGVEFANQYPTHSYSQISNEGDYRFFMHLQSNEEYEKKVAVNPNITLEYCMLSHCLERIQTGIRQLGDVLITEPEEKKRKAREKRAQLVELYDRTVLEFHQTYPEYEVHLEMKQLAKGSEIRHARITITKREPVVVEELAVEVVVATEVTE